MGCVIVTCPTRVLVEQWYKELNKYGFTRILEAFESTHKYINKLATYLDSTKRRNVDCCYYVKNFLDTAFAAKIRLINKKSEPALLIADEMHNLVGPIILKSTTAILDLE